MAISHYHYWMKHGDRLVFIKESQSVCIERITEKLSHQQNQIAKIGTMDGMIKLGAVGSYTCLVL